ncbi:hypothetical protein COZ40_02180 [Candidatus Roizmanbacteria bacterium CG_4_10_14_3_um_filter_39_13]|uniref:Peptidase S1 domain-containing protein n=2 Tax=Candidatus Roizmaniibacteriota TaxID=1752723 RepID=A0A2M7LKN9_9BACT|nr:MAG: hypothetical protein COZ40_02180 [Candidatus Roizmanbacteria bacterium CG_4_10_14_3_um_filter_39_13]
MLHNRVCIDKKQLLLIFFVFILVVFSIFVTNKISSSKMNYQSKAASPKAPNKIIGGVEVTDSKKWPFMVHLYHKYTLGGIQLTDSLCSGTLIAPNWVLTAGHCAIKPDTDVYLNDEIMVVIGTKTLAETDINDIYKIKGEIHRHPLFNKPNYLDNDIALYELDRSVRNLENTRGTISINSNLLEEREMTLGGDYRYGVQLGYGDTEIDDWNEKLHQGVAPVLSNIRTNKTNWLGRAEYDNFTLNSTHITSGYPLGGVGSCDGDSGGPLITWNGKKWVQIGISSLIWGYYCGEARSPSIFTRVSAYVDWIGQYIKNTTKNVCTISKYEEEKCGVISTFDPNKGIFIGTPLRTGSREQSEFECRINNFGPTPTPGASYKCGYELKDDDKVSPIPIVSTAKPY